MPETGKLTQSTRRSFIRGIATAGASTAAVVALERAGIDLFGAATADAAGGTMPFADFKAIAPSAADAFQVPEGFRADLLIRFGDEFANDSGETLAWGYNNDFLAFFPLGGKTDEGLLFANHEYPSPFFQHGYKEQDLDPGKHTKSAADVQAEQDAVGNSILHIKRGADGVWAIVSPSPYNRRIHGDRPALEFTGPRAGDAGIGESANGSVGNCSGGITPWGTALSCEENFDGYGLALGNSDFQYGWVENGGEAEDAEYHPGPPYRAGGTPYAKYGWVCEHDPYDPSDSGRKHTALGRFRHENTAFRQAPGKPFVLYMGDDKANEGIYRFVSDRSFQPGRPANNRRILEEGTLSIARFEPEGRRRFAVNGDTEPTTATEGTGTWVPVLESELDDTATKLRARFADGRRVRHPLRHQPPRGRRGPPRRQRLRRPDQQLDRARRARLGPADRRGRQRPDRADVHVGGLRGRRADRARGRRRGGLLLPRQPRLRLAEERLGRHRHLVELAQQARAVRVPRQQRGVHGPDRG